MSQLEEPSPAVGLLASVSRNPARVRTLRLPEGEIVELVRGWNDLGQGRRAYLRKDGSVTYDSGRPDGSEELVVPGSVEVTRATPSEGTPYQRTHPPFEPGNTVAVSHGAGSPRIVEPLASELVTTTVEAAPFLDQPSFHPALKAWARAEARCALLAAYLDEHGLLDEQGQPRPATKLMTQMENLALKQRARLGLDAASRAGIEASLTSSAAAQLSLEAALDRGAEQLRQRMAKSEEEQA